MKSVLKFFQYVRSMTLAEWLVVLSVVMILAAMILPAVNREGRNRKPNYIPYNQSAVSRVSVEEESAQQKDLEQKLAAIQAMRAMVDIAEQVLTNNVRK